MSRKIVTEVRSVYGNGKWEKASIKGNSFQLSISHAILHVEPSCSLKKGGREPVSYYKPSGLLWASSPLAFQML